MNHFSFVVCQQPDYPEHPFSSEIHFPLPLPLTSNSIKGEVVEKAVFEEEEEQQRRESDRSLSESHRETLAVSCDHNYTVEDSAQLRKRIDQLEERVWHLRKKLKTKQQKIRRQESQVKRLKAICKAQRNKWDSTTPKMSRSQIGKRFVILPEEMYNSITEMESWWGARKRKETCCRPPSGL